MNDKIKQETDTRLQDNEICVAEHIPQVSVCMPMYNAPKYLRECIDSVLAQTFKDFEFLIVDDGSCYSTATSVATEVPYRAGKFFWSSILVGDDWEFILK